MRFSDSFSPIGTPSTPVEDDEDDDSSIPPPLPPTSTLPRYNRAVTTLISDDGCTTIAGTDGGDLTRQKEELVTRLSRKVSILASEQTALADETTANDALGVNVARKVSTKVRPVEASKFRSYVDDVGHITMLLLSLSGRLAKTENDLQALVEGADKVRFGLKICLIVTNPIISVLPSRKSWN